ncbi:MAG: peptidoglycan-associated lipoprotein Pal [Gallionellaceae bacterium]
MNKLSIIIAASLALSACASTPKIKGEQTTQPPPPAASEKMIQPAASTNAPQGNTLTQAEIDAQKLASRMQELQKKSVYFDFDKSNVKSEYQDVIQQQADFMKSYPKDAVTLQGNCDERGSAEYNLALGDRRANSVRKEMVLLGIPNSNISTVSFGKESPRLTCHEEKCWKENRRVDFVHQTGA